MYYTKWYGEHDQCEQRCGLWLCGDSEQPPDHVCQHLAVVSLWDYVDAHAALPLTRPSGTFPVPPSPDLLRPASTDTELFFQRWCLWRFTWPLPISAGALQHWWNICAPCWYGDNPHNWPAPPLAFAPLATGDVVWAGLAAWRTTDAGVAWLLGTVRPAKGDQATRPIRMRGAGVVIGGGTVSHYEIDQLWCWDAPVLLLEVHAQRAHDIGALLAREKTLHDWYMRTLYGKPIRKGGPPPAFLSAEECRTAVVNAIRQVARNRKPTQAQVAQSLNFSERGLREVLQRFGLLWDDLLRESRGRS